MLDLWHVPQSTSTAPNPLTRPPTRSATLALESAIVRIAEGQLGLVTLEQAAAVGVDREAIRRRVRAGLLVRLFVGVSPSLHPNGRNRQWRFRPTNGCLQRESTFVGPETFRRPNHGSPAESPRCRPRSLIWPDSWIPPHSAAVSIMQLPIEPQLSQASWRSSANGLRPDTPVVRRSSKRSTRDRTASSSTEVVTNARQCNGC